ncbi:MAG: mechanosensitive ion channel domain-containing protein [Pseudomonadota bacterium]
MKQFVKIRYTVLIMIFAMALLAAKTATAETDADLEKSRKISGYKSAELLNLFESAVVSETGNLEELKKRLGRLETLQKAVLTEINAYHIQNSAHGNFLLNPATPIRDLEKAFNDNRLGVNAIDDRLNDFIKRRDSVKALQQQTQGQMDLSARQKTEIKSSTFTTSEKTSLVKPLNNLIQIMDEKKAVLQKLDEALNTIVGRLQEIRQLTYQLAGKFEQELKLRTTTELFERKPTAITLLNRKTVAGEFLLLAENFKQLFSKDFWAGEGLWITDTGSMPLLTLLLLAVIAAALITRLHKYCRLYENQAETPAHSWRRLYVTLIRRSLILLGPFLVFYVFEILQFQHFRLPFIRVVLYLLLVFLICRWTLDFLKLWQPGENMTYILELFPGIRRLARTLASLGVVYIVIMWAVGGDSGILFVERLAIEIGLTVWCFTFWRAFHRSRQGFYAERTKPVSIPTTAMMVAAYVITIGGLITELAGYPALALYWLVSLGRSLVAVFWAVIFFNVIREWNRDCQHPAVTGDAESTLTAHPLQRLAVQVCWLLWTVAFIFGLILAWSNKPDVFYGVSAALKHPFSIGQINLSLMGLIYAVLILFFTRIFTRLGKYLLEDKIFVRSDLEKGLQDSITTISVYLMWGLGLIIALSALGVSTTSLAVVFGALSIGIGFGLQTIFNNFISGIILLFERPIQVGDAIEIGGIWGEVKKINVRATVVQTFDNASLIIPNSEFISSQVTNWSFKEPSLRRKLDVGVAYGSDVELVKKTLLEIAEQTQNVRRKPKSDVIFLDHGDSALIFRLRYWTVIDHYYTTWSDIRFSIDRLFRERNIEIAFPQRDIHIRTIPQDSKVALDSNKSNSG